MKITDITQYLRNLAIKLFGGNHDSPQSGMCIMECVAYINGEQHTDHPECACPVITSFAIRTNDWMNDVERGQLLPFVLRIAGSKSNSDIEYQRAYMTADYAVRVFAPIALRAQKLEYLAKRMEACEKIMDKATAKAGKEVANGVHKDAAAAAAYAADAAAYQKVRSELVDARLSLLHDMLKLTEEVEATPVVAAALERLVEITA